MINEEIALIKSDCNNVSKFFIFTLLFSSLMNIERVKIINSKIIMKQYIKYINFLDNFSIIVDKKRPPKMEAINIFQLNLILQKKFEQDSDI